jgi:hypothetical protein
MLWKPAALMVKNSVFLLFLLLNSAFPPSVFAQGNYRLEGVVKDSAGNPLPYASVLIKGTTIGTTTNESGRFVLQVNSSSLTLVFQYIGYVKQEKTVNFSRGKEPAPLEIILEKQAEYLSEVIVKAGGEDPAYEIMRQAIRKRKEYLNQLDAFSVEAYIKTIIRSEAFPSKFFGQKISEQDKKEAGVDSTGKGVIFLSESVTKIAYQEPNDVKLEVISGRESGSSGFGFNFPTFINFYNNQVNVLTGQLNPRGFVSPVADAAMNFYRYKYLGSFWEDGNEIHDIEVIPRRKFEPLFTGTIRIMEGSWRIHSLDLLLSKTAQLEILDTLQIRQTQVQVTPQVWRTKDQVIRFNFNQFGLKANGDFLNVYSQYNLAPNFPANYFNKTLVKYDTAVNKRSKTYWDSIRPVPLAEEEIKDFKVKDSTFEADREARLTGRDRDSLLKKQGPVKWHKVLYGGLYRNNYHPTHRRTFNMKGIANTSFRINTVEGVVLKVEGTITQAFPQNKMLIVSPNLRYGWSNGHFNAYADASFRRNPPPMNEAGTWNDRRPGTWLLSGGKRVLQYNREEPIGELINSLYTMLGGRNYMKLYEAWFVDGGWQKRWVSSFTLEGHLRYEDRRSLNNSFNNSWTAESKRRFTENYPTEQLSATPPPHQALTARVSVKYQPGQRFIEYPRRKVSIGSKWPVFAIQYEKGIPNLLSSDVNFDKWSAEVSDEMNFKLKGEMKYRLSIGGFLQSKSVFIQDWQHFNGNQTLLAGPYLNSFQLAPYYANSTTAPFYLRGHLEHHFNGMLTNKIPLFRRLNWHLVGGANTFYVNQNNNYVEGFVGLENIFKVLRVDVIGSWLNGNTGMVGVRLGFGGIIGGNVQIGR